MAQSWVQTRTVIAVVAAFMTVASTAKAGDVSLDPSAGVIAGAGMTTDIDVVLANGIAPIGIDLTITYDDSIVTATNATSSVGGCLAEDNVGISGEVRLTISCGGGVPDGVLFTITFQGVSTGISNLTYSECSINEDAETCNVTNGTVEVQGPTPTASPTSTTTGTPTETPTFTLTPTQTDTPTTGPTFTPTQTPTITGTSTPTSSPTITPTVSPTGTTTNTPTVTPTGGAHTTGLAISKSCPPVATEGQMITCTIRIENQDTQHGATLSSVTNTVPFFAVNPPPNGPTTDISASCGTLNLGPNDGNTGTGPDFTTCFAEEIVGALCTPGTITVGEQDMVAANGVDADPVPIGSGGFGGLPISATATNTVIVTCNTPTPTNTPTLPATPTPTPTSTPTRTNTPGPTNTVPPIPVVPSPMSPSGMLMIGALGLALVLSLRRIARG